MPEYEVHNFSEVAGHLRSAFEQHQRGEVIKWEGPDQLHHNISAGCPGPSVQFSPESLAYSEEDQGYDFLDVFIQVCFQLGYHNGAARLEQDVKLWRESSNQWQEGYFEMRKQAGLPEKPELSDEAKKVVADLLKRMEDDK